jgi:hypothetical protein
MNIKVDALKPSRRITDHDGGIGVEAPISAGAL